MKEQKSFEDLAKTLQSYSKISLGSRDINYMKEEIVGWIKSGVLNDELEKLGCVKVVKGFLDRQNDGSPSIRFTEGKNKGFNKILKPFDTIYIKEA